MFYHTPAHQLTSQICQLHSKDQLRARIPITSRNNVEDLSLKHQNILLFICVWHHKLFLKWPRHLDTQSMFLIFMHKRSTNLIINSMNISIMRYAFSVWHCVRLYCITPRAELVGLRRHKVIPNLNSTYTLLAIWEVHSGKCYYHASKALV